MSTKIPAGWLWRIKEWLAYYRRASTIYDLHSPLVYGLIQSLKSKKGLIDHDLIALRRRLKRDGTPLPPAQTGAGSARSWKKRRTVGSVARFSVSPVRHCQTLYGLVQWRQPAHVLELGTSLGLSALYLQRGHTGARVVTIEGDEHIASVARQTLAMAGQRQQAPVPDLRVGLFDQILAAVLAELTTVDLVFIDGDHTRSAVLRYVDQLRPHLSARALVIVHDIYWSADMKAAWRELQGCSDPFISIDLFDMGILVFDPSIRLSQHISYIAYPWKPWRIGLFA